MDANVENLTGLNSDPYALARCLAMLGSGPTDWVNRFPQLGDGYPPPTVVGDPTLNGLLSVSKQRITSVDKAKHIIAATIRYRSPTGPGGTGTGAINYTVEDRHVQSSIKTTQTANGTQQISVWYLKPGITGYVPTNHVVAPDPPNFSDPFTGRKAAVVRVEPVTKITSSRVIVARGVATQAQWNTVKAAIRGARSKINQNTTGDWSPRGKWLFLGPSISYTSGFGSASVNVELTFLEATGTNLWFPLQAYFNQHNEYPADAAPESALATAGGSPGYPPPVGNQIRINGLTMASVQLEADFNALFGFAPI
jgi:hypothetical protein